MQLDANPRSHPLKYDAAGLLSRSNRIDSQSTTTLLEPLPIDITVLLQYITHKLKIVDLVLAPLPYYSPLLVFFLCFLFSNTAFFFITARPTRHTPAMFLLVSVWSTLVIPQIDSFVL